MSSSDTRQYVTFGIGKEVFAAPVELVREILDYREAFRIPKGPDYLIGLTDVRGKGVPTIDLRLRLGLEAVEPTAHTRILVVDVEVGGRTVTLGLVTDRVYEVASFSLDQIDSAPEIGVRWASEYIGGVISRGDSFVVIVNLQRLFSTEDVVLLSGVVAEAA